VTFWDWIAGYTNRKAATPATPATVGFSNAPLSQQSRLSQGQGLINPSPDALREAFEERAAIMEFDAGLTRDLAERQAARFTVGFSPGQKVGR
jgi:hypothetical protein